MPNLFTKATQKFNEVFSGPRTKDTEFESMINEFNSTEKSLLGLKNVFQIYLNFITCFKTACSELYTSTLNIYEKDSPYASVAASIVNINSEIYRMTDEFNQKIIKLLNNVNRWSTLFEEIKSKITMREEMRKTFDHYDEKMEKMIKTRMEKIKKNIPECNKDIELYQRNEEKFKKSMEEYVNISIKTYKNMNMVIERKYELVNPIISELFEEEKMYFSNLVSVFLKNESVGAKFKNIGKLLPRNLREYDPLKYVRCGELMKDQIVINQRNKSPNIIRRQEEENEKEKVINEKKVDNIVNNMNRVSISDNNDFFAFNQFQNNFSDNRNSNNINLQNNQLYSYNNMNLNSITNNQNINKKCDIDDIFKDLF